MNMHTRYNRPNALPFLLFLGLISAVTALQAVVMRGGQAAATSQAAEMEAASAAAVSLLASPETDRTLAQYARVSQLLKGGGNANEAEALRLLEENRHAPLVMAVSDPDSGVLRDRTPSSVVIQMGRYISQYARQAAEAGDRDAALRWVRAGRHIAAQLLVTPGPTLETVMTVRSLDSIMGLAEINVYRKTGSDADVSRVALRERALKEYVQQVVLPSLGAAHSAFERSMKAEGGALSAQRQSGGVSSPEVLRMRAAQEADIAADMLALYRARRGDFLGEAA